MRNAQVLTLRDIQKSNNIDAPEQQQFRSHGGAVLPAVLAQMLDACVREDETFAHAAQLHCLIPLFTRSW
jgi:hypothetical protein